VIWWNKLSQSWIYRIFNNIFYTWDFLWKWCIRKWTHKPMITYEEFYRVQEMIGARGIHIKWKTREFAYTWFIRCWECWSAITAEQKTKKILTTWDTQEYIYYHCTKRKWWWTNCKQKYIRLEDLERQIDNFLEHIEITPEFIPWWLEILKNDLESEIETKKTIQKNFQSSLEKSERKLKNLTDAFIWELIEKEEYTIAKNQIKIDIGTYKDKLARLNLEHDESIDTTEQIFNFIIAARTHFNHWNLQTKKEICRSLGLNWKLEDWILHYDAFSWFQPIQEFNWKYCQKNSTLEPSERGINTKKLSVSNIQKNVWCDIVRKVRTAILKNREKIYLPQFCNISK
jgi:tetratricopeptide (TPR) repeat protein